MGVNHNSSKADEQTRLKQVLNSWIRATENMPEPPIYPALPKTLRPDIDNTLWADPLYRAIEQAITRIQDKPAILLNHPQVWDQGPCGNKLNRLLKESGLGQAVFGYREEHKPDVLLSRVLCVYSPDKSKGHLEFYMGDSEGAVEPEDYDIQDTLDYLSAWLIQRKTQLLGGASQEPAKLRRSGKNTSKPAKYKLARSRMLQLHKKGQLPDSIRQTAELLKSKGFTYSTVRTAAHRSQVLLLHYELTPNVSESHVSTSLLEELTSQADEKQRNDINNLSPEEKVKIEQHLRDLPRDQNLSLIETLSINPDALGKSSHTTALYNNDQDMASDDYTPKKARRRGPKQNE